MLSDVVSAVSKQTSAIVAAEINAVAAIKSLTAEVATLNTKVAPTGMSKEDAVELGNVCTKLGNVAQALESFAPAPKPAKVSEGGLILKGIENDAGTIASDLKGFAEYALYVGAFIVVGAIGFAAGLYFNCCSSCCP